MLFTGPGDELCGLLPALFQAGAYHLPPVDPPAFPAFVYCKFAWRLAPCPSPLLQCTFSFPHPLLCASFQFIVYCSVFGFWFFFFCRGWRVSLPRGLCWFIPGVAGGILFDTGHSPVWSAACLLSRFGVGVWRRCQPPIFSV
jgi:hypothetical protein